MATQTINADLKRFVRLNLSIDRWNTKFGFQVVLLLLLTASWNASTVNACADTPNEDTVYLRFQYQSLREMEAEFYKQNLSMLKKLRWDRRRRIFLVVDETYDAYFGKKRHWWINKYKPAKGCAGSFKFLTFALAAPKQWRRVVRCIPVPTKQNMTPVLVETAVRIRKEVKYDALLLDRGFYEKEIAFSLDKAGIPFLIRAELRGKIKKRLQRISHHKKYHHWRQRGFDPLILWLGWKKVGNKRYEYGFVTNTRNLSWFCCINWYSHRWNIENVFKATDGIQFKTATAKVKPRFFAVLLSFYAYNEWQKRKHTDKTHMPLAVFVEHLINRGLVSYLKKGPPFKLHIPGWLLAQELGSTLSKKAFPTKYVTLLIAS